MSKFNPFRPGSIVGPGMFAGRDDELSRLEQCLVQTKGGNPGHFLIHGERGIGKSSLMLAFDLLARGDVRTRDKGRFQFLTLNVELDPSTTYRRIITKVGAELSRCVAARQVLRTALSDVWDFVSRWEVMGVKYNREMKDTADTEVLEELCETFVRVVSSLGDDHDGVYLLIDEADKPPTSANLGEFVKVFTERLTKRGCDRIGVGIAGLTSAISKIRRSHPSSVRILTPFRLEPLLEDERREVISRGLDEAEKKNGARTEITDDGAEWISKYSEGYPHFIQQYAYSAFEHDDDQCIDKGDVKAGAYKENGALEQLGMRYFEEWYFHQIGSDDYRTVLKAMAAHGVEFVKKQKLCEITGLKYTTLTNALTALKKRNTIVPNRRKPGEYRLPSRSFATWILAFSNGG